MSTTKQKILVVDDEEQIRSIIGYVLTNKGYEYYEAASLESARAQLQSHSFGLIILDVMLPDGSGVALCREIRNHSNTPILLLSALNDAEDRIAGLEAGADDYVAKPFSPRELLLRVEILLRRKSQHLGSSLTVHGINLDDEANEISYGGQTHQLSAMETRVLALLMRQSPRTVTFREMLSEVWGTDESVGGREMVRITVYRLRNHLREFGVENEVISTVRGTGYRILSA